MMASFAYLLLASFLATGYSWVLTSTHSNVIPKLTDNVTLQCFYEMTGVIDLTPLSRIRLLKEVNQEWEMYAQILPRNRSQPILNNTNQIGVSVSGRLGQPRQTYLSITWSTASDDTVGSYQCEVDGFTAPAGTNGERFTRITNITKHEVTVKDLFDIIVQMREKSALKSEELQLMDIRHASHRQELENRIMKNVKSDIEDDYFEVRYWPTGQYMLPTDAYGCPNTPFSNLSAGYQIVQSETTDRPQHVFPPRFNYSHCTDCGTRNVLRFNYCVTNRGEPRLLWPRGSYCISRAGPSCTSGFNHGATRFFLKSLVNLIATNHIASFYVQCPLRFIEMYICCRSDGDVNTPILLPNAKPFYLYRFGGTCQTVYNMDVTNVKIQIDTDDTKRDYFSNHNHADGTINKGSLELCYYTKKNTSTHETSP